MTGRASLPIRFLVVIQEVVGGIEVDPQQRRGMLANTLLEQGKRLLTIAKPGMDQGQVNRFPFAGVRQGLWSRDVIP
jgi:hypothetical protein